jgi:hypothetical protein
MWRHGVLILSDKLLNVRLKFEKLLLECSARPSIPKRDLGHPAVKYTAVYTSIIPNSKIVARMQRLLRKDDETRNPYLKWSRETCLIVLASRGIMLHHPDTMSRFECRNALEDDKNAIFPFMMLPREIRNSIYKYAVHQRGLIKKAPTVTPALLHTSKQVREECQPIFISINRFQLRTRISIVPTRTSENKIVVTYPIELNLKDVAWLRHIGSANVAKLRYVAITASYGSIDWPSALHVDLPHSSVKKWSRELQGHDKSDESDELKLEALSEFFKSHDRWVKRLAAEAKADEDDFEKKEMAEWVAKCHLKIQGCNFKAQWDMLEFKKQCGKGKTVAPTTEGSTMLAKIVAEFVKQMEGLKEMGGLEST